MNETLIHVFAYFGAFSAFVLFILFLVWLQTWIPSRASKDYVYEKTSAVQRDSSDWYGRLSQRITTLERNAQEKK